MTTVDADGVAVRVRENDRPLLLTLRMAAGGMHLWEPVWPALGELFSVATFDLPVPEPSETDVRAMFRRLGDRVCAVASALGHDRFHFLGWQGGASLGLHMLADHGDRLASCVLFGAVFPGHDRRALDRRIEILDVLLRRGSLETYTWNWLLQSYSAAYAEERYDELEAMVARRLEADAVRKLDPERVLHWIRALFAPAVTDAELGGVRVPTLVVATPADADHARRLQARIPTADLAVVAGGPFVVHEQPEAFLAAVRPFLRAVASGATAPARVDGRDRLEVRERERVVRVVEPRACEGVVFLHGWLMSPAMWDAQLEALRGRVRCVAVAQPGHDGTAGPPDGFSMDDWADATWALLDDLALERVVLVGHSMGGMLALAMTRRRPDAVAGLGIVASTDEAWNDEKRDAMVRTADAVAAAWGPQLAATIAEALLGEAFLKRTPGFVGTWTSEVARYDLPGVARLARAIAGRDDMTHFTPSLSVPVTVIHGIDDDAVTPDHGKRLAARMAGARLVEVVGAGHCPPLEDPDAVTEAVEALVRTALQARARPMPT